MDKRELPIAVFDSGVGGISVLKELIRLMPGENFLYFGDSANAPYGVRPTEQVRQLTLLAAKMLGVDPADCIVFEDSLPGIGAAMNAGMQVVAVGGIRSDKAVLHIPHFQDIDKYFV